MRLDIFLQKQNPGLTRSYLKRLIDNHNVTINNLFPKAGTTLKRGRCISLHIPPPEPMAALPEPIPLDIVAEDEDIIVINKPAGLVVHPAAGNYTGTLVNGLLYHCQSLPDCRDSLRPGIVHRLDKDTSGVMVVAKNDRSHNHLALQFKNHTITRRYLALALGTMRESQGTISSLIGRHPKDRKKMSSRPHRGRLAVTHWKVMKQYHFLTLLAVTLETGRTHQIRVHLASIHHPVLGDPVYGGRKPPEITPKAEFQHYLSLIKRQALHAATLGFIHPRRNKYVEFTVPVPEDLQAVTKAVEKTPQSGKKIEKEEEKG
ncbi:MAG: RluA family pseudouridine synthase [Deltaproteobacteria bacterium]|nr:RluA family pseudouridine synthase [Deltaproteobacteria bacterium]